MQVTHQRSGFGLEKPFGLVPDLTKNPTYSVLAGLLTRPDVNLWFFGWVYHTAEPHFWELRSLASIMYLSFDPIRIWYIHKRCSFGCSFVSHSVICDLINIGWVTLKNIQFMALCHSNPTNSDRIAHWIMGGERSYKTASFAYILYCYTIRT